MLEDADLEDTRITLMVHDIKPPFLDGRIAFTRQTKPVQVVKDPTSDFVKLSKKGSATLKHIRDLQDRTKMREKFWDLAGTKMGKLLKVEEHKRDDEGKQESDAPLKVSKEDEVDYRAEN